MPARAGRVVVGALLLLVLEACGGCDDLGEPVHVDCGNGVVDALETCDGTALGGATCRTLGYEGGSLGCTPTCGGFVVAQCEGLRETNLDPCIVCGDGEQCVDGRCALACEGETWESDVQRAFDLRVSTVSGVVRVDGAPLALDGTKLRFRGDVAWQPGEVEVQPDGSYVARLVPGTYQVTWVPGPDLPISAERLTDVAVETPEALADFELTPWREVSLAVETEFPGAPGDLVFEALAPRFALSQRPIGDTTTVWLRDGEHRIWWSHLPIAPEADPALPDVEYLGERTLDELLAADALEIAVIETSVHLTMNGAPPPTDGPARVELVRADEQPRPGWLAAVHDRDTVTLDAGGRGSTWVLDRPRDIAVIVDGPPMWGWFYGDRDVDPVAELEVDLGAYRWEGEVRRNGGRLPNGALPGVARGLIELSSDDGFVTIEIGESGRGEFAALLPPGSWDARINGNVFAGVLPIAAWALPAPVVVQDHAEDVEIDVPAVRLAGQLTMNGERLPDEDEARGSLLLRPEGASIWYNVPIGGRGPAGWDVIVAPGTYEAEIVRLGFSTDGQRPAPGALPFGSWSAGELDVPYATRHDVDVRVEEVTVTLVEHEGPARAGLLWFESILNERAARTVETTGEPVTVTLYPGYYRVAWTPTDDGLPRSSDVSVLESTLAVDGPIERTYDVGRVRVHGALTVNGEAVSDAGDVEVELTRLPPYSSVNMSLSLPASGPATFEADLVAGYYAAILGRSTGHEALPDAGAVLFDGCRP